MADSRKREKQRQERSFDEGGGPIRLLIGPEMRLVIGTILIGGCAWWLHRNGLLAKFPSPEVFSLPSGAEALPLPFVGKMFTSYAPGVGGLILLISTVFRKRKIVLLSWPAAAAAVAGPMLLEPLPKIDHTVAVLVSITVAIVIAVLGLLSKR